MAALRIKPLDFSQISMLLGGCDGTRRRRGGGLFERRVRPPAQTSAEDVATPACDTAERLQTRRTLEQHARFARDRAALLKPGVISLRGETSGNCPSLVRLEQNLGERSQSRFADRQQTVIIFDLDDTLFPTSCLKQLSKMNMAMSIEEQHGMSLVEKTSLMLKMAVCEKQVLLMLEVARQLGEVAIVTLASPLWLDHVCRRFWPDFGRFLKENKPRVIHGGTDINYERAKNLADNDAASFWCGVKAEAMAMFARDVYSKHNGQTWKNILSIGDSNFERFAAWRATTRYMKEAGIALEDYLREFPVGEQHIQLRTKSVKMFESPSIDELCLQAELLQSWLPWIVELDDSIDIDFRDCYDAEQIHDIQGMLQGVAPLTPCCARRRMLLARGETDEID